MTTTMGETDLDTDLFTVLDFDYEVPCTWGSYDKHSIECDQPADWKVTVRCCGYVYLVCDEHWNDILDAIALYPKMFCNMCKMVYAPPSEMILSADRLDRRGIV